MKMERIIRSFLVASILMLLIGGCGQDSLEIHESVLTIDTHVDTPVSRSNGFHIAKLNDRLQGGGQVDFPRMKQGGLDAICYAVFLSQGGRTAEDCERSTAKAEKDFADILEVVKNHPDQVELALTPDDAYRIEKTGKRILFLSIGTDFDGGGGLEGCQDASEVGNVTAELLRRGYSKKDIRKIWGGNFMRVMRRVQDYAKNSQRTD